MIELIQFPRDPFCIVQQRFLELAVGRAVKLTPIRAWHAGIAQVRAVETAY